MLCRLSPAIENLSPKPKIGDNRLIVFTINCKNAIFDGETFPRESIWATPSRMRIEYVFCILAIDLRDKSTPNNWKNFRKQKRFSSEGRCHCSFWFWLFWLVWHDFRPRVAVNLLAKFIFGSPTSFVKKKATRIHLDTMKWVRLSNLHFLLLKDRMLHESGLIYRSTILSKEWVND